MLEKEERVGKSTYLCVKAVAELRNTAGNLVKVDRFSFPTSLQNIHRHRRNRGAIAELLQTNRNLEAY